MPVFTRTKPSPRSIPKKRAEYFDISDAITTYSYKFQTGEREFYETLDSAYRALCAVLYNYVPASGHPGGSISCGRIAQALVFGGMDYDFVEPDREDADHLCYAAGHKALGLYALWALRDELARIGGIKPPQDDKQRIRLEDLLGFRRNACCGAKLFTQLGAKALDGHPTPATPFVKLCTGASGVGLGAAVGLALSSSDIYRDKAPSVHIIEGEGGLTPGRAQEALAIAATAGLSNTVLHVDWNQSSIDSDQVCPENGKPGDYVQWNPAELLGVHDWNVVLVPSGHDFFQILAAQQLAASLDNGQPTAVVYRTVKGWRYGIQGRASHGTGHAFSSDGFYAALEDFNKNFKTQLPHFTGEASPENIENCYWNTLLALRKALESRPEFCAAAAKKLRAAKERLDALSRKPRSKAPNLAAFYGGDFDPLRQPSELKLKTGENYTLRGALAAALAHINRKTGGAVLTATADLGASTSAQDIAADFAPGFYNRGSNPDSRLISGGGICEDAAGALMTGVSAAGRHIGVTASYSAFIAALEHIPARLHAIGQQARRRRDGKPYNAFVMINAHAGSKTGEDGPTHADPQSLQLLQENFPKGAAITLTPWEPAEIWPLLIHSLQLRPALIAPFVTRPAEPLPDRLALGLEPAEGAVTGIYLLAKPDPAHPVDAYVVLQGNGVTNVFVRKTLPELRKRGRNVAAYYVASAELFALLPEKERDALYPPDVAAKAIGITDFTLPTMRGWIRSRDGLKFTLHPYRSGAFPGGGAPDIVLRESGQDAQAQLEAVENAISALKRGGWI